MLHIKYCFSWHSRRRPEFPILFTVYICAFAILHHVEHLSVLFIYIHFWNIWFIGLVLIFYGYKLWQLKNIQGTLKINEKFQKNLFFSNSTNVVYHHFQMRNLLRSYSFRIIILITFHGGEITQFSILFLSKYEVSFTKFNKWKWFEINEKEIVETTIYLKISINDIWVNLL